MAGFQLSLAQERLWKQQEELKPLTSRLVVRLSGAVDADRLREALAATVAQYEILRTLFRRQAGLKLPFQVIQDRGEVLWTSSATGPDGGVDGVAQLMQREVVFDLAGGPLVAAELLKVRDGEFLLLLCVPTLVADLRGLVNLVEAVGQRYAGGSGEEETLQYADIVQWQSEQMESEEARAGRDFWKNQFRALEELSPTAELPGERESGTDGFVPRQLDLALSGDVVEAAAGLGATVADVMLACWVAVLSRLSGEAQIKVGCSLHGRKYEELEDALGLFASTAPLLFAVDEAQPFAELVKAVAAGVGRADEWQECFSWPAEGSTAADAAPHWGFAAEQVDFSQEFAGVLFTVARCAGYAEPFRLRLDVTDIAGGVQAGLSYDGSYWTAEQAGRISERLVTLTRAALAQPEAKVGTLPVMGEAERRRVLEEWNSTEVAGRGQQTLHAAFEAQAERTPERVAVQCGDQTLTYAELNAGANQLAHYLISKGVGRGSLVGLCLERSTSLMVAVWAILKAGGAYVAVSPDNPRPRLALQLGSARALITESRLRGQMPEIAGETVLIDEQAGQWADAPRTNPDRKAMPEDLVYVIHTSGSTGVPKGVAVRHRNLGNYTESVMDWLQLGQEPEGLSFATVSTIAADLGNTCVFPALLSGGTLHVLEHEVAADSQRLAAYAARNPIDVLKIVPSHLEALLGGGEAEKILPRKYLITGGEALTTRLMRKIAALTPSCEVRNHYGPTETTVGALTLRLAEFDWQQESGGNIPLGRPLANARAYVLNTQMEPLPAGVAGELYLGGAGVAAGYLNQPQLTAERFVADPFSGRSEDRLYRTGDRARFRQDGLIEFLGRADEQVKIRGFRVELGEIEAVLSALPGVRQAVVLARQMESGQVLVAYVAAAGEPAVSAEGVREQLKQHLPDYMVPAHVVVLPRIPLTANGKIDRGALPEPQLQASKQYVAPRTPEEEVIAGIWADVLRRDEVGTEDDFFELGGHSLLATQVISRIRRMLQVDVPLRTLFEKPTVRRLAQSVEASRRARNEEEEQPPMVRVSREEAIPLSFPQQRLWVLDQLEPNNPLYNIPRRMRLKGALDKAALHRALQAVVDRHESQRTSFAVRDGQPVQVIAPALELPMEVVRLSGSPEERIREAQRLASVEALTPFDLCRAPLLRATLLELGEDDHVLLLTMHHIVSDAWSAGIFFGELDVLYEAFSRGQKAQLPELALQYADYAAWQRGWYQGDVLRKQLDYWRKHLEGAPPVLQLRSDRARPQTQTFAGAHQVIHLPAELSAALRQFSREEGLTLFMTLLAGFQVLLSRYSGQDQIAVGTDLANRSTVDTERMIGFFINLLALRTDLSGNPTVRELLGRVREVALGAYAHQEMPFDKIVEELQPERSMSHNPVVQVLFVMQNIPRGKRRLGELELQPFELPILRSKFDIAVFMVDTPDGLVGNWVYSTDLFDGETIARMGQHFQTLLQAMVNDADARIGALQMLSEQELDEREAEKKRRKQSGLKKLGAVAVQTVSLDGGE